MTEGSLIPQYRQLHAEGRFPGVSLAPWVQDIARLITQTGATTLLDYGCGKGQQYLKDQLHMGWGIMPTLYDPAVPGLTMKPRSRHDGVISTDVAEHIPEQEVMSYIADLHAYAKKFIFVSVCCRPAKRKLPDGRNAHVTIRPIQWWKERFEFGHQPGVILDIREAP